MSTAAAVPEPAVPAPAGHAVPVDSRRRTRRRGPALEQPIYAAVLAELADRGFAQMSMERVAARAGTGKSAIYRRWDNKLELVVDTLAQVITDPVPVGSSGSLREDLLIFLRKMAKQLDGPAGTAIRANIGEVFKEPELRAALLQRVIEPMQRILRELVTAAVSRGEARPGALAPECLNAGPALLRQHFLEHGAPIPDAVTVAIVDNALMPMLRSRLAERAGSQPHPFGRNPEHQPERRRGFPATSAAFSVAGMPGGGALETPERSCENKVATVVNRLAPYG